MADGAHQEKPISLFYSYSHRDEKLRKKLEDHLGGLRWSEKIAEWHDRNIDLGDEWAKEIDRNLTSADIILLLVSASFIASKYCWSVEMKKALERHDKGEAKVIPVILRPCAWQRTPFAKLQAAPTDAKPVASWSDPDEALCDVARKIERAVIDLQRQRQYTAEQAQQRAEEARKRQAAAARPELCTTYLQLMVKEWNTLRLQVLDPSAADTRARPVALEQVYVSLNTTAPRPKELYLEERPVYDQPPLSAVESLCHAPQGHLVLLGQPGSGKSTFSRYLALTLAEGLLSPGTDSLTKRLPGWKGPARLPVIVSLGRLAARLTEESAEDVAAGIRDHVHSWPDLAGYGQVLLKELQTANGLVIFDGLDEVPGARRALVKAAMDRFATVYSRCWVVITCRTHSYQQDVGWRLAWPAEYELAPFSPEQMDAFITAWYDALSERNLSAKADYQRKSASLKAALTPNDPRGLRELARTPLLLTVMAIVHTHKELPGHRVAVYRECVDILLLRWQKTRAGEGGRQSLLEALAPYGVTEERQLEQGLCEVAYRAHEAGEADRLGGSGRALVSGDTLRGVLYRFLKSDAAVNEFLDYCQHANGLLLAQGSVATSVDGPPEPVYAFPHLSFEEYLAARHLRRLKVQGSFTRRAAELAGELAWREVIRFLGEYLCHDRDGDTDLAQALLARLCPKRTPADDRAWRRVCLAGELLPALQEALGKELNKDLEKCIVEQLIALLQDSAALREAPQDRSAAGRALVWIGDPRPGVGLKDGLPDLLWVRIPGTTTVRESGQFPNFTGFELGNGSKPDPEARDDEVWSIFNHSLDIPDFALTVYPLTVAQFKPFVDQGGYQENRWWSEAGRQECRDLTQPYLWDDPTWTLANHPVIGISWYEAEAYCNWLNEQWQLPPETIRLPTEAEWEWAARGPEGRRYPWGDQWESWRCNGRESGIGRTSAVGCFPGGAAEWWSVMWPNHGVVHDLVGNALEWSASAGGGGYLNSWQSMLNTNSNNSLLLRGGSWDGEARLLRSAARFSSPPWVMGRGFLTSGFRLVRTFQPSSPHIRIGAISSQEIVKVFEEKISKENISPRFVDLQTFLFVKAWVRNIGYIKNVWVDVHIFDHDNMVIGAKTLTMHYLEAAGGGEGDFFLLHESIYQARTAGPGWCARNADDRKVQYRLYYEVNNQTFTDGLLHEFAIQPYRM